MDWNLGKIAELTDGVLLKGDAAVKIQNAAFDSRQVKPDSLFIPIIGKRVDGHDFIADAAGRGAIATLAGFNWLAGKPLPQLATIGVDLPVTALQLWARRHLSNLKAQVVGITGSSGKTTTKEMVAAILASRYSLVKNEGNLNTEIGLPLTIIKAEPRHEWLVLEMGMDRLGEIALLSDLAKPDIAILTNVGEAHIELLGSRQNIAAAKAEIFQGMKPGGITIANGDDPLILKHLSAAPAEIIYFGLGSKKGQQKRIYATNFENKGSGISFLVHWLSEEVAIDFPWPGRHNVYNITAAIAAGIAAGLSLKESVAGLESYRPVGGRLHIRHAGNCTIIDDTYNANPSSMQQALEVLATYPEGSRRIAVLGDMLELGELARHAHVRLGEIVAASGIDVLITVGEQARNIAAGAAAAGFDAARIYSFTTNREATAFILAHVRPQQLILIKGSRGMQMEEIVAALTEVEL